MNLEKLLTLLQVRLPDLLAVYMFGSQATGDAGAESDLDVALLSAGPVEPSLLWPLSGELADIAGVPVDLLDLRAASTVMQYQILTMGRCLWSRNSKAALFESFILSEKTALDTARAGLLADIQKEGKVYGR